MTNTTATTPVMRFLTLGGAHVAVMNVDVTNTLAGHTWQCLGCDYGVDYGQTRGNARNAANTHAAVCRSIPKDSSDHPLGVPLPHGRAPQSRRPHRPGVTMPDLANHLHIVARTGTSLSGNGHHLTPTDIEGMLNGTPYRDELALWDVVAGRSPLGYVIVPGGWVAVVSCGGADEAGCKDVLFDVTVTGDVRHGNEHPDNMIAGIRRVIESKEN